MSEYILIDVSKHDEENRKMIRDLLEQRCGFVVPRCTVKDTGKMTTSGDLVMFEVVHE